MPRIAITCTAPRCHEIVEALRSEGIMAIPSPILTVTKSFRKKPHGTFDAVLVSSPHAIHPELPTNLSYIAIGAHTAKQLQSHGYNVVQTGKSCLQDMDLSRYQAILYPCAAQPSHIPDNAIPWVVYETEIIPQFEWIKTMDVICVYSARAATAIEPYVPPRIRLLCLSGAIANVFSRHPVQNLAVCDNPDYDSMKLLIETVTRT